MRRIVYVVSVVLLVAGIVIAQAPAGGDAKAPTKGSAKSPASRPVPPTVTPQTYTAAQIRTGSQKFTVQCGFCHGRDATGGEGGGPDLTRSLVVAEDVRGSKIGQLLGTGPANAGEHSFKMNAADQLAIVAFIHDQKNKLAEMEGNRRDVEPADLLTGNAEAGKRYFEAQCARCHSVTGDFGKIGTRFQGLALMQRMLNPSSGRPAPARPKATVTLASGQVVTGPLAANDEFTIAITDAAGARQTYQKSAVKFLIDDPMSAHFDQLGKYTDKDMHDVYAYLVTLK